MINLDGFLGFFGGGKEKKRDELVSTLLDRKAQLEIDKQEIKNRRARTSASSYDPSSSVQDEYRIAEIDESIEGVREELRRLEKGPVIEGRNIDIDQLKS